MAEKGDGSSFQAIIKIYQKAAAGKRSPDICRSFLYFRRWMLEAAERGTEFLKIERIIL